MSIDWEDFRGLSIIQISDKVSSLSPADRNALDELLQSIVADSLTRPYSEEDGFIMDAISEILWE